MEDSREKMCRNLNLAPCADKFRARRLDHHLRQRRSRWNDGIHILGGVDHDIQDARLAIAEHLLDGSANVRRALDTRAARNFVSVGMSFTKAGRAFERYGDRQ